MTRYFVPALFVAATAWAWNYNATHTDRKLLFPLVDTIFPEAAGDPAALGTRSVQLLGGVTGLFWVLAIRDHVRSALRKRQAKSDPTTGRPE